MDKVWLFVQESNVDGEMIINVTPCADLETAKAEMAEEIDTLLSEGKYSGLDLDEIERDQDDDGCHLWHILLHIERSETSLFLTCTYDDYYEKLDIFEKEIVNRG